MSEESPRQAMTRLRAKAAERPPVTQNQWLEMPPKIDGATTRPRRLRRISSQRSTPRGESDANPTTQPVAGGLQVDPRLRWPTGLNHCVPDADAKACGLRAENLRVGKRRSDEPTRKRSANGARLRSFLRSGGPIDRST
jgi:hypothetical protein